MRHVTEVKRTEARIPRHMRGKSAQEIVAYIWETRETQIDVGDRGESIPTGMAAKMMWDCAAVFFCPEHWKNPFYAIFPQDAEGRGADEWVKAAVMWFHGDVAPYTTGRGVGSRGYMC